MNDHKSGLPPLVVGGIPASMLGELNSSKKHPTRIRTESSVNVYDEAGELVAVIKRDDKSKKTIVYLVTEASPDEVGKLITNESSLI